VGVITTPSKFYPQGKNFKEGKKSLWHASHAILSPTKKILPSPHKKSLAAPASRYPKRFLKLLF